MQSTVCQVFAPFSICEVLRFSLITERFHFSDSEILRFSLVTGRLYFSISEILRFSQVTEMLHFSISGTLRFSWVTERLYFSISEISRLSAHWEILFSFARILCLSHWETLFFHLFDPSFVSSLRESVFPSLGSLFVSSLRESIFPSLGSFVCQLTERIYFSISEILRLSAHWETVFSISRIRLSGQLEAPFFIPPLSGVTERLYYFSISRIFRLSAHLEAPFFLSPLCQGQGSPMGSIFLSGPPFVSSPRDSIGQLTTKSLYISISWILSWWDHWESPVLHLWEITATSKYHWQETGSVE